MRTSLEKADEEDLSVSLSWNGVELPKAGRLYYLPVEDGFDVSGLTGLSAGKDAAGDGILYLDSHLAAIGLSPLLAHNTTTEVYYVTETQYVFLELCFTTLPVMAASPHRKAEVSDGAGPPGCSGTTAQIPLTRGKNCAIIEGEKLSQPSQ